MSIFKRAVLATLVAMSGVYSLAAAADEPLTGLPYLFDANDKLIGPFLPNAAAANSVLMRIDGRFVAVPANSLGFFENYKFTLYYKNDACKGTAYMAANTMPLAGVENETLYYPAAARQKIDMNSRRDSQGGSTFEPPCQPISSTDSYYSKIKTKKISALKFTPPFELRPTAD